MGVIYRNGTFYGDTKTVKTETSVGRIDSGTTELENGGEIFNSYYGQGKNSAKGKRSHSEGMYCTATGDYAHAEGYGNEADGKYSHVEGLTTQTADTYFKEETVLSDLSNTENVLELGSLSNNQSAQHAEGHSTTAIGSSSHSEGKETIALGSNSHAEGCNTFSNGINSHSEGYQTISYGNTSHSEGIYTVAGSKYQHVQGKTNVIDTADKYAMIIGGGAESKENLKNAPSPSDRKNIFTVDWSGNIECGVSDSNGNFVQKGKINGIGMVICTQEEYDSMESHDSSTLYIIGD